MNGKRLCYCIFFVRGRILCKEFSKYLISPRPAGAARRDKRTTKAQLIRMFWGLIILFHVFDVEKHTALMLYIH